MALWDLLDLLESRAEGAELEPMAPGECQAKLEPRETEVLMGWLGFLVKRDIGVNLGPLDLLVPLERMEKEEMMERSDPGDSLANPVLVACWDQRDLRVLPDPLVLLVWTATRDPKETLDLKESLVPLDSRETPVLRDLQGHREPLDPQERRVLLGNQACQGCRELTAPRVTLERKDHPETKDTWAPLVHKDPLAILGLVV